MADESHLTSLEQTLTASATEAEAMRQLARSQPASEDDLAQALGSLRLVDLYLTDLLETLRQIFVAGLSFPDPELPTALDELRERARALRLPTALERLGKLRSWLMATIAEPDLLRRAPLAAGAWDETQRLLAWTRLYRAEHDLRTVQARLAAEAHGLKIAAEPTFKTCSLTAWPLGLELAPSGKLVVHALATDTGRPVVLTDHLAEVDQADPFGGRVISRMFQEAIELPRLMRSLVRLEDHPYTEKDGAIHVRPAFRAIPKMLGTGDNFRPPRLPTLDVRPGAELPQGPFLMRAALAWSSGRLTLGSLGGELPLRVTPLLRFNLAKLLVREGLRRDEIELCLQPRDDEFDIVHVVTSLEGRAFPATDPSLYAVAREVLQARAERVQLPGEPIAALTLRTATHVLGRGKPEAVSRLRKDLLEAKPQSLEDHYRLAFARSFVGMPLDPNHERTILQDALALLLLPPSSPVDSGRLGRVLGLDAGRVSAGDLRQIDGAVAYRVLWLALQANLVDELRPLLEQLFAARYQGELHDPSVGDVCARALLLALLSQPRLGATAVHTDLDEDDEDDEDEQAPGEIDRSVAGWTQARDFLQAHLDDLAPRKTTTRSRPLPEAIELLQLGDTRAFLLGEDRFGRTVEPLKLPADKLRHACVEALLAWCAANDSDRPTWLVAVAAADALLLAVATGQDQFLLS